MRPQVLLRDFLIEYALRSKENLACSPPVQLRRAISELNGKHPDKLKVGHQDAAELFGLLRGCYNVSDYLSVMSKEMIPDRDEEEDITLSFVDNQNAPQYPMIEDSGHCKVKTDRPFCLELPLLSRDCLTFQECFAAYLNEATKTELKYSQGFNVFKSQASTQITLESLPDKGLLVSYKRFTSDGGKIHSPVILDNFTLIFGSTSFTLKGFIVHKGASLKFGHYVTYCFCSNTEKWYLFDDRTVVPQTEVNVKEAVQGAYILFFEPTGLLRQSYTIRINLNADFEERQLAGQLPNEHRPQPDRVSAAVKTKRHLSEDQGTSQPAFNKKARIEKEKKIQPMSGKRARLEEFAPVETRRE